jgi:superfamily II DNA/RNA helicase
MLNNPMRIEIAASTVNHDHIEQRLHYTDDLHHKQKLLSHVLRDTDLKQAIVFTATKRDAEQLSEHLADAGFSAGALHGDMHQGARNRTLGELRRGNLRVLVATDVAARGIDVPDITHVVNFDLPKVAEDYVHRIGRTGRAGRSGIAINLVGQADITLLRRIERLLKRRINPSIINGLEPRKTINEAAPARPTGRKKGPSRSGGNKSYADGYRSQSAAHQQHYDNNQRNRRSEGSRFNRDRTPSATSTPRTEDRHQGNPERRSRPMREQRPAPHESQLSALTRRRNHTSSF